MKAILSFITAILLFSCSNLQAQTVKVIDQTTLQPVEHVYIYNGDRNQTTITNLDGEAALRKFSADDSLTFQHPAYKKLVMAYRDIQLQDFTVKLSERSVMMGEIYVSASKREQDLTEIPQRITRINPEQTRLANPQTTADLLESSGKVFVQKSQLGGGSPMIRGFAANSVLIAVDGIRMNNAIFRSGNLQNVISIDPNILANTEVIFGPGSVIYGSDALGGVMNFQTRNPELSFSANEVNVQSNSLVRYSSANHERTIHADASLGYQKWGFLSSITYGSFDDLRSGSKFYDKYPNWGKREEYVQRTDGTDQIITNDDVTIQRFSGYQHLNLMQKVRYKPNSDLDINYGFHYATTDDIPRYDRLIERTEGDTGQFKNAEWYYGPQIWMSNILQVDLFSQSRFYDKISATGSYQWFQESRNDRKFRADQLRNREENVDVFTVNIDFDKPLGTDNELYYGVEGVYNYVRSDAISRNIVTGANSPESTRYPDGGSRYTQWALYGQYKHQISEKFTAVAGTRYSHIGLVSEFDNQFYNFPFQNIEIDTGALNGSLGFTYRPYSDLQFNLNGSTGFRAPNVDDAAKVFDSEPGTVVVPNDEISPEYSYNLDFAIIKTFGERIRFEANTFYTWLRDAMVRRDFQFNGQDSLVYDGELSNVEAVVNAGKAHIYGISAALDAELLQDFSFEADLTYTEGKDLSNNEPLRHVAPFFVRAGISYTTEKLRTEVYTVFNGRKDISDFSPSERNKTHLYTDEGSPAWHTINIKASYQASKYVQINLGVENILDKHYRPYSSGISAPGRNVILALRATI